MKNPPTTSHKKQIPNSRSPFFAPTFNFVDPQEIKPISTEYDQQRLDQACRWVNKFEPRLANGLIAKKDGILYDFAGRHRNFSATFFSDGNGSSPFSYIPANVVDCLEDAIRIYDELLQIPTFGLNEIGEDLIARWNNLEHHAHEMEEIGYRSLADVVKTHPVHFENEHYTLTSKDTVKYSPTLRDNTTETH